MTASSSPWVTGTMAPVHEEVTAFDLPVTGTIPDVFSGRYLRNRPNPIGPVDAQHHWFVGDGMVHGVRLRDGRAEWYRNRWVRSPVVAEALGEPVPPSPFTDDVSRFGPNTNVIGHAGQTWALVEAGSPPVALTTELETIGPTDLGGTLEHPFSAHPKRDPATGELHVAAYYWAWGNQVRYLVVGVDGRVRHQTDVPLHGAPMMHDVSITESRVVLYDLPCVFNLERAMAGDRLPYHWDREYQARVGVLPLGGDAGDAAWIDVEPCYVFHPMNAYDDGDRIVVDLARWATMFDTDATGPSEGDARIERWIIDPRAGSVATTLLDERGQEFPRVDERVVGRPHRYGYTVETAVGFATGGLFKHDLITGRCERHDFGRGHTAGEFVFVPASADAAEDDGYLVGLVQDLAASRSDLVILSAADVAGAPVATITLPTRVPDGFHGNWIAD